jgi:hypothetical protein
VKGAPLLATLVGLASVAGVGLYLNKPDQPAATGPTKHGPLAPAAFVARNLELPPSEPSPFHSVTPDTLRDRIGANLDAHFGPGGLAHRTRAFELLTLLPSGQNLHGQLLAMQAIGTRGWFDDRTGQLLVLEDFAPLTRTDDRATAIRLHTRSALHRQGFTLPSGASDDEWITRRILHGALADALQLADQGDKTPPVPTSEETEREAILMSLPVFILNLAQSPEFLGLPYLQQRREVHPTAWLDLLRIAPKRSHEFYGITPDPLSPLPTTGSTLLEESFGAFTTQLLLERHSDYERAEELTPHWRGDHYRLFSNGRGDHVVWHCQWDTPEAAENAVDILRNALTGDGLIPGTSDRHVLIDSQGPLLRILNCSDSATLAILQN